MDDVRFFLTAGKSGHTKKNHYSTYCKLNVEVFTHTVDNKVKGLEMPYIHDIVHDITSSNHPHFASDLYC